jgi:hypothetical protein
MLSFHFPSSSNLYVVVVLSLDLDSTGSINYSTENQSIFLAISAPIQIYLKTRISSFPLAQYHTRSPTSQRRLSLLYQQVLSGTVPKKASWAIQFFFSRLLKRWSFELTSCIFAVPVSLHAYYYFNISYSTLRRFLQVIYYKRPSGDIYLPCIWHSIFLLYKKGFTIS